MADKKKQTPKVGKYPASIDALKPAPYNASLREISDAAMSGLRRSLEKHGDLSGITFNLATGNLVSGHQRLDALKAQYGADNLRLEPSPIDGMGMIYAPDGSTFPVRYVHFTEAQEKAANLAANSTDIAGEFLWEGVEQQLAELKVLDFDLLDTGFSAETLEGLLGDVEKTRKETQQTTTEFDYRIMIKCDSEKQQLEYLKTIEEHGIQCQLLIL